LYWDGQDFRLLAKRLEKGRFTWPITKEGTITLTPAQMSMLLEGPEWRFTQKTFVTAGSGDQAHAAWSARKDPVNLQGR
jgi:transposase